MFCKRLENILTREYSILCCFPQEWWRTFKRQSSMYSAAPSLYFLQDLYTCAWYRWIAGIRLVYCWANNFVCERWLRVRSYYIAVFNTILVAFDRADDLFKAVHFPILILSGLRCEFPWTFEWFLIRIVYGAQHAGISAGKMNRALSDLRLFVHIENGCICTDFPCLNQLWFIRYGLASSGNSVVIAGVRINHGCIGSRKWIDISITLAKNQQNFGEISRSTERKNLLISVNNDGANQSANWSTTDWLPGKKRLMFWYSERILMPVRLNFIPH